MITTTIDKSKIKDFEAFKGLEWREATPEEVRRVRNCISKVKTGL